MGRRGKEAPMAIDLGARVFISCGQKKGTTETQVARRVAKQLRSAGFCPYIAAEEQTLQGLKESIFQQLRDTEYSSVRNWLKCGL